MNRVFVDMDGVIVQQESIEECQRQADILGIPRLELHKQPGFYLNLLPIPGALKAVGSLIGMGYDVWIATKPPTGRPQAYADKARWILEYLPELKRKIIITHDKGLLGDMGDFLIDDRPHKANCWEFRGTVIEFGERRGWPEVLEILRPKAR